MRDFFDKLLHNSYELLAENFKEKNIKVLVSIRSPEQTIKSIIHLFDQKKTAHPYSDPVLASRYYIERIKSIRQFCVQNQFNYYYYDAELIRIESEKLLVLLQNWLSLRTPLTEKYQLFSMTGEAGAGDSSEIMKKGEIVKQKNNYDDISIPDNMLQQAINEYQQCRQIMVSLADDALTL